jgi:hypothetical protein
MKLRSRLTYANVVATVALVAALVGIPAAVAITKSSTKSDINGKGIIRAGRVTNPKLADGAVTASKLGGINVVQVTNSGSAFAPCPTSALLVGGGGQIASGTGALAFSGPTGTGWTAGTNAIGNVTAYALCIKP